MSNDVDPGSTIQSSLQLHIPRLPDELLSVIFECYMIDWEQGHTRDWSALWSFLRTLSLVCWQWREVAFRTPLLWRNVYHNNNRRTPLPCPFDIFIQRSKNITLNVWASGTSSALEVLGQLSLTNVPSRMHSLHMTMFDIHGPRPLDRFLHLPCFSVKELSIHHVRAMKPDFIDFLMQFSSVESLHVVSCFAASVPPPTEDRAVLSHLRSLQFRKSRMEDVENILGTLSAPVLVEISIHAYCQFSWDPRTMLGFSNVRELTIAGTLDADSVRKILRWFPLVETLQLMTDDHIKLGDPQLVDLIPNASQAVFVPRLQRLHVSSRPYEITRLFDVIHSRTASTNTAPIKAVAFPTEYQNLPTNFYGWAFEWLSQRVTVSWWDPPCFTYDFQDA